MTTVLEATPLVPFDEFRRNWRQKRRTSVAFSTDFASGGVSSKRENAEFVGRTAAETLDGVEFRASTLPLVPPKRGGDPPADWRSVVKTTAEDIVEVL